MKLLFIEDQPDSVLGIKDHFSGESWECECSGFDEWKTHFDDFDPDILVLDWRYDADNGDNACDRGHDVFEYIWAHSFRPVVIFSALADAISSIPEDALHNPLVSKCTKGSGGEGQVIECISSWKNLLPAVRRMKTNMNKALIESLQIAPLFGVDPFPGDAIFMHMMGKRAANFFGNIEMQDSFPAWVQYIYPPMGESFFVGDVLRKTTPSGEVLSAGEAEDYSVILTPSCDISNARTDIPLLMAHCEIRHKFADDEKYTEDEMSGAKPKIKRTDKVKKLLNHGYNSARVALPEIPGIMPYLTVNLKKLSYDTKCSEVALHSGDISSHKYYRIASLESPYREQLVWAHLINSCRPGVPVRDMDGWAEGVLTP